MLEELKRQVCAANLKLLEAGVALHTWGNISAIDRANGCVVIKPSGMPAKATKPEHLVVVGFDTGDVLEGNLNAASDTPTHLLLYRAFPTIASVVHAQSLFATA